MKRFSLPIAVIVIVGFATLAGSRFSASESFTTDHHVAGHYVAGCYAPPMAYTGAGPTDCVAPPSDTVAIDDTLVSAKWSLARDQFGFTNVCAAVSIKNENNWGYSFNDIFWTLRTPSNQIQVLNFTAPDPLGSGYIAHGHVAKGNICFNYTGLRGEYVATYAPVPLKPVRGVWLFRIS